MPVDAFRVYGVPEEVSDGTEVIREESTVFPVKNPLPAEQPHPGMSRADANAALLALAQEDGWAALYNPGDASTVTLDGTAVVSVSDSLGNLPDLVRSGTLARTQVGSVGALGTLAPAPATTGPQTFLATGLGGGQFGALAPVSMGSGPFAQNGLVFVQTTPATRQLLAIPRVDGTHLLTYSDTTTGAVSSSTEYAVPAQADAWYVLELGTDTSANVGMIPVVPDDADALANLQDRAAGFAADSFAVARASSSSVGPIFVAYGGVTDGARERANRLLEQLSGMPASIPDPEGAIPSGYVVQEDDGTVLAWHRPDRPEQLASVTKVWTCALAYQILSAQPGWNPDSLLTMVASYVGDRTTPIPWVDPGDQMTYRDAFHGSLMVSHNVITDAIATAAGAALGATAGDEIPTFVQHMNDEALAMGWSEAVFTTPQGRYDSILSPRHVAEMLRWVEVNVPFVFNIMSTVTWSWEQIYGNPVDPEEPTDEGTWTNIVRPNSGGVALPELVGGKSGDTPAPAIRTIAVVSDNLLANLSRPSRWYTAILNTTRESYHRYRLLRNLWTDLETFNEPPVSWSAGLYTQMTWVPYDSNTFYAAGFRVPGEEGGIEISPLDPSSQALPRMEAGDIMSLQVSAFRGSAAYPVRLEAILQGGRWDNGSSVLTEDMTVANGFETISLTGTVARGGILTVRLIAETNLPKASIGLRNVVLELTLSEKVLTYYDMDLIDYSVKESAQSIDSADLGGSVGEFSVQCRKPEAGSVVQMFGSNWLKGREVQLFTRAGRSRGTITDVVENDETGLSISAASVMQKLVAQQAVGEAFSGSLEALIFSYLGQVDDLPGVVEVDPSLIGIPVTAPSWRGELWEHVKMLGAAYGFNLRVDGFRVLVEPVPRSVVDPFEMISNQEQLEDGQEARYVEVVRRSGEFVQRGLVYPPGGLSSNTEVITVQGGETVTIELQTETSLLRIEQPVPVDRVEKMETNRSVYSIVDDHGRSFPAGRWTELGGSMRAEIGPEGDTILVTIEAPRDIWIGGSSGDDNYIQSFTIGSLRAQGEKQFSTLRILGSGVGVSETVLRVPTGLTNVVTEVGTRVDNPFLTTMALASEAGTRAALKYGGFRPSFRTNVARAPIGSTVNGGLQKESYDYRILEASHTPGGTAVTAEYSMDHETYSDLYPGETYGDIQTGMDPYTYWDDQVIGKRRP